MAVTLQQLAHFRVDLSLDATVTLWQRDKIVNEQQYYYTLCFLEKCVIFWGKNILVNFV